MIVEPSLRSSENLASTREPLSRVMFGRLCLVVVLCLTQAGCGGCGSAKPIPKRIPPKPVAKPPAPPPKPVANAKAQKLDEYGNPIDDDDAGKKKEEKPKVEEVSEFPEVPEPTTITLEPIDPAKPSPPAKAVEQTVARMKKIVFALNAYAKKEGRFPAPVKLSDSDVPLLSWRVYLLPYLGQDALFKKFRLSEPWDSPTNSKLLASIPTEYQSPLRPDERTNFAVPRSPKTMFPISDGAEWKTMTDGWSQTIALLYLDDNRAVPWTKPDDIEIKTTNPVGRLGRSRGGFLAALANGDVGWIPLGTPRDKLLSLFTVAGDKLPVVDVMKSPDSAVASLTKVVSTGLEPVKELPGGTLFPELEGSADSLGSSSGNSKFSEDNRAAVPDTEAIEKARKMLREVFKADIEANKKYDGKRFKHWFATTLMEHADKVSAEPAAYYVLLDLARDNAAGAGDYQLSMKAAERLVQRFKVDTVAVKRKTLVDAYEAMFPAFAQQNDQARKDAEALLREAVDMDDFEAIADVMNVFTESSRRTLKPEEITRAQTAEKEVDTLRKAYQPVPDAREVLKQNPNDPAANFTVGNYLCLAKTNWKEGLPLLAKGNNTKLRVLAAIDLENPKEPSVMADLANEYWDLAEHESAVSKRGLQMRAVYWYRKAVNSLPAGLARVQGEKRIEEAKKKHGDAAFEKILAMMASSK